MVNWDRCERKRSWNILMYYSVSLEKSHMKDPRIIDLGTSRIPNRSTNHYTATIGSSMLLPITISTTVQPLSTLYK